MQTRCLAAIERAVGRGSVYYDQAERVLRGSNNQLGYLAGLIGVVESLLHNIRAGYIHKLEELVHGEVFGDFLEMAQYLLDKGYKDAAAVMAGSTLEAHLRQLCKKVGISVGAGGHPKRADRINGELAEKQAYSKLDQKNVTAWLGLRNNAAHGNYEEYNRQQVSLLISSIRDFIVRSPA